MGLRVVDIADMKITDNPADTLITYSLGSCIGVAIYDPVLRLGGMIHCMLPLSKVDKEKARVRPYMFVDTGMQAMLGSLYEQGMRKARAVVNVAGGAKVLDNQGVFKIGERNFTVLRKILWKNGLLMNVQEVGGNVSRTVSLDVGTGRFSIKSGGKLQHYDLP
ncbi:MAG TPA: chemotaxis protein CheD [Desulfosalsimonadaceae bacterium]|nr:chemotaxis protein CheD [Desulfosalsimonadaceae bacterium]